MKIVRIEARQILDSRGNPTVEADVWLDTGVIGRAAVPSGASTGIHEAHELRDGGDAYNGLGVTNAISNINGQINDSLVGAPADDQFMIDQKMIQLDGTKNKSRLGANAILAVSLATAHAAAKERGVLLYVHINDIAQKPKMSVPIPMMNVLNGGKHASHSSDFQEFMIIPTVADSYAKAVQIGAEVFHNLKQIISERGQSTAVGDEGGFTYPVKSNREMFELLVEACKLAGYEPGAEVNFAIDAAASEFYSDGRYTLASENRDLSPDELTSYYHELLDSYPLVSIEDSHAQDDWANWVRMRQQVNNVQLVGDDLLVTNLDRLEQAIQMDACNAILIKPNQIGTLTETIKAITRAKEQGWNTVVSHRSGETEDVTIAHIAVGTGAGQIKTGSLSRGERTAKHNELLRIEEIDEGLKIVNPLNK
jgi:enolase